MIQDFESKFGALEEGINISGLKKVIPMELLTGRLRGQRYSRYLEIRETEGVPRSGPLLATEQSYSGQTAKSTILRSWGHSLAGAH